MTARQTTAGTASDNFRAADPPPIPQPRQSDDPAEPGARRETTQRGQR